MKFQLYRATYVLAVAAICSLTARADAPDGYYSSCTGKNGSALLSALNGKVGAHTVVSYDGLWNLYNTSDILPNGKIRDIYSTKQWTPGQQHCGNYKLVGDCINREHSFPKSWFSEAKPMYSDAFHLYPTDGKVNGQRSNFPYGECAGGTTLPSNGDIRALGRLGNSTFAGYTGKVFEPDDKYKGDLARSYFYMAAAYNDKIKGWSSPMLAGNTFPAFADWAIQLLLKWHRQDPVSDEERARNEAIYAAQKNRNPFIDRPEMAEYIWGNMANESWSYDAGTKPAIATPADGSTISLGTASVGVPRSITLTVKGTSLNAPVAVTISGNGFAVSTKSLAANTVNAADGAPLTITYTPTSAGAAQGKLSLSSGTASSVVTLTVNAVEGLPATPPTQISDCSFVAHWTYIGNADSNGCYRLNVTDEHGEVVDTYPRSVPASDEEFLVDELLPSTHYIYTIANATSTSQPIHVVTADPIQSVQLLYPDDLLLTADPNADGTPVEIMMDVENIDTDITLSVNEPFALSSDKDKWVQSLSLSPEEDRFYLRINATDAGTYATTIVIRSSEYYNDSFEVEARVSADPTFNEDFEANATGSYDKTSVNGTAAGWLLSDAGVFAIANEAHTGKNYVRMGKTAASTITMDADKQRGIGVVTMWVAGWSAADGAYEFDVQTSSDQGLSWTTAQHVKCPAPSNSSHEYSQYTVTVNRPGAQRLRIAQTYGKRFCIDNIAATDYTSSAPMGVESDPTAWDAFCRNGQLTVTMTADATVHVCGTDGIVCINEKLGVGTHAFDLPKGLYIITVNDFSRRVLVR